MPSKFIDTIIADNLAVSGNDFFVRTITLRREETNNVISTHE